MDIQKLKKIAYANINIDRHSDMEPFFDLIESRIKMGCDATSMALTLNHLACCVVHTGVEEVLQSLYYSHLRDKPQRCLDAALEKKSPFVIDEISTIDAITAPKMEKTPSNDSENS